jgi:hypothetical protein
MTTFELLSNSNSQIHGRNGPRCELSSYTYVSGWVALHWGFRADNNRDPSFSHHMGKSAHHVQGASTLHVSSAIVIHRSAKFGFLAVRVGTNSETRRPLPAESARSPGRSRIVALLKNLQSLWKGKSYSDCITPAPHPRIVRLLWSLC